MMIGGLGEADALEEVYIPCRHAPECFPQVSLVFKRSGTREPKYGSQVPTFSHGLYGIYTSPKAVFRQKSNIYHLGRKSGAARKVIL